MTLSKGSKAYGEIRDSLKELTEGTILAVDPSIGSDSSQPGWAVYRPGGVLMHSGTIVINPSLSTPERLQILNYGMRKLIQQYEPDVLVYEAITDIPYAGFSARGHAPLQKALGAILSVSGPRKYVGMLAASWKKMTRESYVKSDEADAIEIGWVAFTEAKRIQEQDPPGIYGKRKLKRDEDVTSHDGKRKIKRTGAKAS